MRRLSVLVALALPLTLALAVGCHKNDASDAPIGTSGGPASHGSADTAGSRTWSAHRDARPSAPESEAKYSAGEASGSTAYEPAPADWGRDGGAYEDADAIAIEEHRPGLGTSYGESRRSSIESVGFRRADSTTPDVVFTIHYDDASGVRSAARNGRKRAWSDEALQQHAGLTFALIDAHERILPAATVGSQLFAVGQPEQRYALAVANDTASAYELVASVDGLDIIDGRSASFDKRGYVIDPFSSMVIEGWRTSEDEVATFRFSSVSDSYADRMGDGRNVGVIGAALFREAPDAWDEWRPPEETWRRGSADPFPGN